VNANNSENAFPDWMRRLPLSIRLSLARRWRRHANKRATLAERQVEEAKRLRDEARRLEALANWIEGAEQ
jgi:hypothetical protein